MGGNHGWRRGDVQRDGIRSGSRVYVGIRWVMTMTGLGTTVVGRGGAREFMSL